MEHQVEEAVKALLESAPSSVEALLTQILQVLQSPKVNDLALLPTFVFADFENWSRSLENLHHRTPNFQAWFDDLKGRGHIKQVNFYGDFSGGLGRYLDQLRQFTTNIFDTRPTDQVHKKNTTDFSIVTDIFKSVLDFPGIEQIVLFSGDGDFSSILSYLKNHHNKKIGIYSIAGGASWKLRQVADWYVELPLDTEYYEEYKYAILSNLLYCEKRGIKAIKSITISRIAERNCFDRSLVYDMMNQLFADNILYMMPTKSSKDYSQTIDIIKVRWDLVPNKTREQLGIVVK